MEPRDDAGAPPNMDMRDPGLDTQRPATRYARIGFISSLLAFAVVHVLLVEYFLPWRKVFSRRPIQGVDYDLHIGQVFRVVEGLRGWGRSWVYDVRLLAGHPEGTITDAGSKAWELWTYCLSMAGLSVPAAFNSWVLLAMFLCPIVTYAAARSFELSPPASLVAAIMASSLWFFDSFIHWVWFVGMVSWALASCLCVLTLGLFYQFVRTRRLVLAGACAICLSVGHLIHPYTCFVLAAPMGAVYLREFRQLPRTVHLGVVAICLVTVGVNFYWLAVAVRHWHYVLNSAFFAQGKLAYLAHDFLGVLRAGENTGVIGVRTGFRILYLGLAVAGLWQLRKARDPRTLPLALAILGLIGFAYVGGEIGILAQIQPYRVLVAATMFSTIPAALFANELVSKQAFRGLALPVQLLLAALGLVAIQSLAQQVLYFTPQVLPETEKFSDGTPSPLTKYGFLTRFEAPSHITYSLPHNSYIEPGYEACIQWLQTHIDKHARLLVQGSALGERLAWRTKFEIIGGFFERNVAHAYANYFRRFTTPATPDELASYLRTYAIEYVVTGQIHAEFEESDALQIIQIVAGHRIYRVQWPVSRVLEGRGSVNAQTNRIDVIDSDPKAPLLLSYHFHEALRCTPNCTVEREPQVLGPVGAIRIPAPHPRALRIYNSYEW
jgi:hypothetical protein